MYPGAMRRAVAGLALTGLLLAACGTAGSGEGTSTTTPQTGVRGVTRVDRGCPVLQMGQTCEVVPLAGARIAATRPGADQVIAETTSGADGVFSLALAPGAYILTATTARQPPTASPLTVTVPQSGVAEVVITFDSGVR